MWLFNISTNWVLYFLFNFKETCSKQ